MRDDYSCMSEKDVSFNEYISNTSINNNYINNNNSNKNDNCASNNNSSTCVYGDVIYKRYNMDFAQINALLLALIK